MFIVDSNLIDRVVILEGHGLINILIKIVVTYFLRDYIAHSGSMTITKVYCP